MSQRVLQLPIRRLVHPKRSGSEWICRRCLATQVEAATPGSPVLPPSTAPAKQAEPRKLKDASEADHYDPTLGSSQRDYKLTKTDFYLKKPLSHPIPIQYLQHSTTSLLHRHEREQRDKAEPHKRIAGVVVSAGKMDKTVKVRVPKMEWNNRIKKVLRDILLQRVVKLTTVS